MDHTYRKRDCLALIGIAVLALCLVLAGPVAAKKKKKGKVGGTVDITQPVGVGIPQATTTTNGLLTSTITVAGKKFKGTEIRDVNVTLTTLAALGPSPADDLSARVTAPNGATSWLISPGGLAGGSVGPLTIDDESFNRIGGLPPAPNATTLVSPYIGTAQSDCAFDRGGCILSALDNGPVSGTWTLRVYDTSDTTEANTLASWRLNAIAGKPFQTK